MVSSLILHSNLAIYIVFASLATSRGSTKLAVALINFTDEDHNVNAYGLGRGVQVTFYQQMNIPS